MTQTKLTISEIAELLGIAPKTIRHYHEIGVLPEPERGENGYRLYTGTALRQFQRIRELQTFGLTLKQIKFILETDEPDLHLHAFLSRRNDELAEEIYRLQRQQAKVQAFLRGDTPPPPHQTPSYQILHDVIKPISNSLADVVLAVETQPLMQLDPLLHHDAYDVFWEQFATRLIKSILPHEHEFILWLERYLALENMALDDRQAQAWFQELRASSSAPLLIKVLELPSAETFPSYEELDIQRLIPMFLYEQATPLQKIFIAILS